MITRLTLLFLCSILSAFAAAQQLPADSLYTETYRSQYHFSIRKPIARNIISAPVVVG